MGRNAIVVGTETGVDLDAGATLSYALMDNAGGRFAIDTTTGEITVANGALLDFAGTSWNDIFSGGLGNDRFNSGAG